jgi:DNA-binding protein H-NS
MADKLSTQSYHNMINRVASSGNANQQQAQAAKRALNALKLKENTIEEQIKKQKAMAREGGGKRRTKHRKTKSRKHRATKSRKLRR